MRRSRVALVVVFVSGIASALAFWFGVGVGMPLGVMLDSVPRGTIALHHINALQSGKTHNSKVTLEGDVDMALVWAYQIEQHPLSSVLKPLWGFPLDSHAEYLTRLANYRAQHPSPLRAEALAKQARPEDYKKPEFREYVLDGARENDAIIAAMIKRYASTTKAQP